MNEKLGVTLKSLDLVKKYFLEDNPNSVTDFQSFEKRMPMSGTWDTPSENKVAKIGFSNMYWGLMNLKNLFDCLDLSSEGYDEYVEDIFGSIKDIRTTYKICRLIARKAKV